MTDLGLFGVAVARVAAGGSAHDEALALVALLDDDELVGVLSGDTPFWSGLAEMVRGGYNRRPYVAGRVERLGIPGIAFSDGPRGVVMGRATCFPVAMARAATWNPDLEERVGEVIGTEVRALDGNLFAGVCINLLRHPAWGRAQETYGEEPALLGAMGVALTRGVQRHVMACVKHFALNSMENARFKVDVTADERALHEVYLAHFRRVVAEGVVSVMSAYNSVNGEWCGQNPTLLTEVLRDEWGFEGFVMSDFMFGLRDAVAAVEAGLDLEMPFVQQYAEHLPAALADGRVARATLERSATRLVAAQLGWAAHDVGPAATSVVASAPHRALARRVAAEAVVLLENGVVDGRPVLPLDARRVGRLAVIGHLAAVANTGDGGSSRVRPPEVITPLEGLRSALPGVEVVYDDGTNPAAAAALAAAADAVVIVVGFTHDDEGEYIGLGVDTELLTLFPRRGGPEDSAAFQRDLASSSEGQAMSVGGDRTSLRLPRAQEVLIEAVSAAQPRSVVAVMAGSAVVMESWRTAPGAVLMLWYPGMEGGHALADVVLGRVCPSGRLPFVVPTDASHLPTFDRDATAVTYDLWPGQRWLLAHGHVPSYPVGFGRSYTSFAVDEVALAGAALSARVHNTGTRRGAEVVQVWASSPGSAFERAPRQLLGFARIELDPGESGVVSIPIEPADLAVRVDGRWVQEPLDHELHVGTSALDPSAVTLCMPLGG